MATYTGTDKRLKFLFDIVSNLASIYSNSGTYAVGAYAIYQGVLYKCITAVTVAEDFDPTKWAPVLVMNEIGSGGGGGSTVTITPTLSSGTKIADFSINGISDELYAPSGGGGETFEEISDFFVFNTGYSASSESRILKCGKVVFVDANIVKTSNYILGQNIAGTVNSKYSLKYHIQSFGMLSAEVYNVSNQTAYVFANKNNANFEIWANANGFKVCKLYFMAILN